MARLISPYVDVAQMDGKIAAADDFFRILRAHTDQDISGLVGKYFLNAH